MNWCVSCEVGMDAARGGGCGSNKVSMEVGFTNHVCGSVGVSMEVEFTTHACRQ